MRITVRPGSYPIAGYPSGQVLLVFRARRAEASELTKIPSRKRKQIEEQGFSFDESHLDRGIFHLAVPSGQKSADNRRTELEVLIKQAAEEISERIG